MDADEEKNRSIVSEAGSTPSFVPSSLASFVANAQATLDDVQHSLRFDSPEKSSANNASVSMDQDASFASMREDEDDKKLKQEVLDKLNKKNSSQVIDEENNKEASILSESATLLLDMDEEEKEAVSPGPSPIKAVDTFHEHLNISVAESLSPEARGTSPADTNQETNRDSGSSRASGWKNLIAAAPVKTDSASSSPAKDSSQSIKASMLSPGSAAKSIDKSEASATPMSVPSKATASTGSKETISSPSIPANVDPMAMSAALEVTSPLASDANPKLSASTPELAASPWKNAFQSMVARLEDRVTPPTPDQSTPSPVAAKQSPPKDLTDDPVSVDVKPSPMIPSSSPAVPRQSVSSPQQTPGTMSSPSPLSQKASPQTRKGLILSPSDSLPPQSTETSESLPSPVAASPHAVRNSGLILSPSDSLSKPRQSGLVLSPLDSLQQPFPSTATEATAQAPRQSGLVLSPSDSLPKPSPSTSTTAEQMSPSPSASEPMASPQVPVTRQSGLILSPSDSLSKPSPSTSVKAGQMSPSPSASEPMASPQVPVTRQSGLILSPSDSLPKPSPSMVNKAEEVASPVVSPPSTVKVAAGSSPAPSSAEKLNALSSPVASRQGGLVLSPSNSLPLPTSLTAEKTEQMVSPLASPPQSAAKIRQVSSPATSLQSSAAKTSPAINTTPVPLETMKSEQIPTSSEVKNQSVSPAVSAVKKSPSKPTKRNSQEFKQSPKPIEREIPVPVIVSQPATALAPQLSADDDAFLPNKRSMVTETPPSRRPVPVAKSEASSRMAKPRSNLDARPTQRKSMPATRKSFDQSRMPSSSSRTAVLKKPTSTPSTGSRLFQPTASSKAHVRAVESSPSKPTSTVKANTTSSRLTQGTAASQARAKIVSPSARKTSVGVEEGRAKARERVRQQKLAAEKEQKETTKAEEKQASRRRTAEEGRALARERIKLRQAQGRVQPPAASLNGKENRLRPPNSVPSSSVRSSRRPTVPKSPNFSTKATVGNKPQVRGVRDSMKLDPNPISRALGSPTHSDRSRGPTARSSIGSNASRHLTIPKAPRLSTTAKYGDKPPPSLTDMKPKPVARPNPPPRKREFKPTQPVPFKFHSSKSCAAEHPVQKKTEPSLAERMQLYARKGLRDESSAITSTKRSFKPTIPKSPQFSSISHRALPKSAAEREEEMMEYYKAHPFKANSASLDILVETGPPKQVSKRRLTQPVPFHFRADERAAHAQPPVGSPDPEAKDLEECKKQFHARPLPRMSYDPPPQKEAGPRPLTTPKPFNFSTDRRAALTEPRRHASDEVEESKQFHARPVPKTTYVGPKRKSRTEGIGAAATPRQYAGPPKLATSARTEPREASRLASQRNAEQMAKQREEMILRKQREKHQEDMAKACLKSPPPNIEPFHLRSQERHETYQRQLAEQLAKEEEEKKQKMLFTAKPLRLSDPPAPIHSNRPATTPRPFGLRSVSRHELWREERRQQLEAEERERQRLMNVKAIPVPRSTYKYSPVTPASQQKRRAEDDGERDLDSARKKAMMALQTAESEMPEGGVDVQGRSLLGYN